MSHDRGPVNWTTIFWSVMLMLASPAAGSRGHAAALCESCRQLDALVITPDDRFQPAAFPRTCHCSGFDSAQLFGGQEASNLPRPHGPSADRNTWLRQPNPAPSRIRFLTAERAFLAPRTWHVEHLIHGRRALAVVECESLLWHDHFYRPIWRFTGDIVHDHWNFYTWETAGLLGFGLGVHAILANTQIDEEFRRYMQDHIVDNPSDFEFARHMGDTWLVLSALAAVWVADGIMDHRDWIERERNPGLADWASQSSRALLVGAPVTGTLQVLIGSSRPGESAANSRWRPFQDSNAISGHAFVGAVPFLVAAKHMQNIFIKSVLVAGAVLPGYSRIYQDKHYLSQVLIGWLIAYLAVEATDLTERSLLQYRVVPLSLDGLIGVGLEFRR